MSTVEEVIEAIRKLSPEERESVVRELGKLNHASVRATGADGDVPLRWSDFFGLGKEIWSGVEPRQYIDGFRDEWEI